MSIYVHVYDFFEAVSYTSLWIVFFLIFTLDHITIFYHINANHCGTFMKKVTSWMFIFFIFNLFKQCFIFHLNAGGAIFNSEDFLWVYISGNIGLSVKAGAFIKENMVHFFNSVGTWISGNMVHVS